ncbi:hypothetical protein Val02_73740 [Virgisporangium aliadipatigenens]|uniref:TIGR01777 family protein n=1 Tax=Virgisporangium aliadipatigenens TaxID=741659 RepID=A0A8J4DUV7_9ACTN|nr:TIGR01777 family oxidoreductase [Virgisporangium aliadipatigenens]GIJ50488.1 hypothetical protein Val02_73740 [Virgisporangium aliadipatigenens]
MKILLAGASGFLGTRLAARLRESGHDVTRLVRRDPGAKEARWDPAGGVLDATVVAGTDAVLNLAGANVGGHRWTAAYKRQLRDSRLDTTGTLARTIAALPPEHRPATLLNASAVGYYGTDRGDTTLDEFASPGDDFLAGLCVEWENATRPAADAGVRVALLRSGLVLDKGGGLLGPTRLQFLLGAGGRLSSGRQYLPWISMADWLGAVEFLLERDLDGPLNLTGPQPVTNAEFTRVLAKRLHRPALIPAPAFALRIALGEFADEMLASRRVIPARLTDGGFGFRHRTVDEALAAVL